MATSPIYSWPEPDNTDLVKNGALAIRTLGNAIDTTMGTMVAKTVVDAKGDLIAGTAADTVNRLAVGNNGETLVADSSTSTGLRYIPATVVSNPVINSSFQIAQRGTSITVGNGYTLDRWYGFSGGAGRTVSQQLTGDTTNLPNIQYCARVQRTNGNTATNEVQFYNLFETINSIPFAGKTLTLSFYARRGANYAPATANALEAEVTSGPNTDNNPISSGTWNNKFINSNVTLTTTWQRFTLTGTMPATDTQLFIRFRPGGNAYTGTAGAADFYEVTGVQLDCGSVALPFRTNGATIQGELAACQRYYYVAASGAGKAIGTGSYVTGSLVYVYVPFNVTMRTTPTLVSTTGTNYYTVYVNNGFDGMNSWTIQTANTTSAGISNGTEASSTQGFSGFAFTENASSSIAFSAEL